VNHQPKPSGIVVLVLFFGLFLAVPAYAYIDPNATSLLTQVLTPVIIIAAAGMTFLRKQAGSAFGWLAGRIKRRKR
jgi:hypothetical protein